MSLTFLSSFREVHDAANRENPESGRESTMIHQKRIDSQDFTTQSISPVTSSARKPDPYRRLKHFATVIFPISARRRAQGHKHHSIEWASPRPYLYQGLPNPYRTRTRIQLYYYRSSTCTVHCTYRYFTLMIPGF